VFNWPPFQSPISPSGAGFAKDFQITYTSHAFSCGQKNTEAKNIDGEPKSIEIIIIIII